MQGADNELQGAEIGTRDYEVIERQHIYFFSNNIVQWNVYIVDTIGNHLTVTIVEVPLISV